MVKENQYNESTTKCGAYFIGGVMRYRDTDTDIVYTKDELFNCYMKLVAGNDGWSEDNFELWLNESVAMEGTLEEV